LSLDLPGIEAMVLDMDNETKAMKDELLRICWYMRGGLSYNESHCLTLDERKIVGKIIESNLETTKETQLPFF
jgi:hypothetical protein